MSGLIWMFSDVIDEEDVRMLKKDFITVAEGQKYYGYGAKPFRKLCEKAGAVYIIGRTENQQKHVVRINRRRLEAYMRSIYE